MVTLKEIARAVGVSSGTVSRVLNFDQTLSVSAKTRQTIIETAEAMKYEPPRARNRANQQGLSKIALVHYLRPDQELVDPYYVALRLGIESRCQALKIETVKVYHTDSLPEASLLQGASGIIAIGLGAGTQAIVFMLAEAVTGQPDPMGKALLMGLAWLINLAIAERAIRQGAGQRATA